MELSEFRAKVRENKYKGSTRSQSPGNLQANLAILPKKYIDDFLTFCRLNYQPCPILVFWGCGVTPQQIALCAKPDFMITHEPGCLLVCDIKNAETYDKTKLS
jgi:uncharacterized protein YcsI (UPF0317 family)